jgi:type I restriction enzyme, S subunit
MITDCKPYPAMKDSGVRWLGCVAAHWKVLRAGQLLREVDVRSKTGTETHLSMSQRLGLVPSSQIEERRLVSESYAGAKLCQRDDLVLNRLKAHLGVFARVSQPGLVSPDYTVLRPVSPDGTVAFLEYVLKSLPCRTELRQRAKGLVEGFWRLYTDDFYQIKLPVPSIHEQVTIVRFLDHADRQIRRFIRAKLELLKLLEEQKQAIIQGAVTCGLDPHVRVKPSGVPWLPDVPGHWDVLSLRRVITQAVDGPHHSPNYVDSGIPFLSARNIKADRWSLEDAKYISEDDYAEFSRRIVPEVGDVLYTKGGTTGVARAVDLSFRFQVWVHVAVLKVKKNKILPSYLALVLNSPRCYEQAQLFTRGATNQDLGLGRMKGIVFALPPLSEQEIILRTVDEQTRDLVEAIQRARLEMELLREYRTRLVADVVTGKLDVREAAARLPEDVEESDGGNEVDAEDDIEESSDEVDAVAAETEA